MIKEIKVSFEIDETDVKMINVEQSAYLNEQEIQALLNYINTAYVKKMDSFHLMFRGEDE